MYSVTCLFYTLQVSIHISEKKNLKNQPIKNKSRLWQSCLLTDRDKMSTLYRGSSIDATYEVSVHLAEGFQRRRLKCEKLMDDRRQTPSDDLWKVLYKDCSFRPDPLINMAATCNSCFWLADFLKSSPLLKER
jgi:hypothetical protein